MLEVLGQYSPLIAKARWTPLGSAGGFSGARIWRGVTAGREFVLKQHPAGASAQRLSDVIHRWMKTASEAGLDFVPMIEPTRDGPTVVEIGGRVWDITSRMRGNADFQAESSNVRLFAAVTALAQLHNAWASEFSTGPCPAIMRRLDALSRWRATLRYARPLDSRGDLVYSVAILAWQLLPQLVKQTHQMLRPWTNQAVALQPCLCDVWHDHVLFEGDRVTGIIDFAAAKVDNVAVDLARMLGSMIPDDVQRTKAAMDVYSRLRPSPDPELVRVLDQSGVVVAATNWLHWLYVERRTYSNPSAVAGRLMELVRRMTRQVIT